MMRYSCNCCTPAKSYSRTDKLYRHRQKYDADFIDFTTLREHRVAEYNKNPEKCIECNKQIEFIARNTKKFCSHSCSAKHGNRNRAPRAYVYDKEKEKERYSKLRYKTKLTSCNGCLKELTMFQTKWCSRRCQHDYNFEQKLLAFLNGENISNVNGELKNWVRDYLLKSHNYKCSNCAWGEVHTVTGRVPLQIDHIDGDHKNNTIGNLRVLCPNCHSLTANYGILNRGKGRTYRIDRMNRVREHSK